MMDAQLVAHGFQNDLPLRVTSDIVTLDFTTGEYIFRGLRAEMFHVDASNEFCWYLSVSGRRCFLFCFDATFPLKTSY
jgi:hypothetical protein